MNAMGRNVWSLFKLPSQGINLLGGDYQVQQMRGIRVKVRDGNLDRALSIMQRQMTSSGMERLIKAKQRFHLKNSEKRVLARKSLERRVQSQDLARKLQSILTKKIRGL